MLEITMKTNGLITFEEGCNLYLQNCKERNLRDDTIRHYRQSYLRFYKHFNRDTLRHTHATELEEVGVDIKEIQRRLGHKSEMTTRRVYVHPTEAMRLASVKIINEMYKK